MGNIFSRNGIETLEYTDFCPLRIVTLNIDIDESINKRSKIKTMVKYFMKSHNGYFIDVMCIQGIRNVKILKEIIAAFKHRIEKYNNDIKHNFGRSIYLEYYPEIDVSNKTDNNIYWSTSESGDSVTYYDKLIISRHSILQSADVPIGRNRSDVFNKHDMDLMINASDSDDISNMYKYIQVVNLNVDGTFVSIYNIELENDSIGISNTKERRRQLQDIKNIIDMNRSQSLHEEMRQFIYGDNTYIACNRDIHLVTGLFHINEVKNGELSSEYIRLCASLNSLDTHRWIASLRKDTHFYESNVRFTKDSYTMLISKNIASNPDAKLRSQKLYELHKCVVINSSIPKHIVDMNQYTNYPEDTLIMLYKPNINLIPNKRLNTVTKNKKREKSLSGNTSRFMDQVNSRIVAENKVDVVKEVTDIPKHDIMNDSNTSSVKTGVGATSTPRQKHNFVDSNNPHNPHNQHISNSDDSENPNDSVSKTPHDVVITKTKQSDNMFLTEDINTVHITVIADPNDGFESIELNEIKKKTDNKQAVAQNDKIDKSDKSDKLNKSDNVSSNVSDKISDNYDTDISDDEANNAIECMLERQHHSTKKLTTQLRLSDPKMFRISDQKLHKSSEPKLFRTDQRQRRMLSPRQFRHIDQKTK